MDTLPNLHPLLQRNLSQMRYALPRAIQKAVWVEAVAGRDVIALAATGSGKTAAFATPVLHTLISQRPGGDPQRRRDKRPVRAAERLRALVLCPTRELAQQVQKEIARIAQGSVLRTACAVGKSAISPQKRALERGVDVLVATPGRAIDLLEAGALSLAHVRFVVIDEGDRMLDMGFLPQVERVLQRVGTRPEDRTAQILLLSATMPGAVEDLARRFLRDPARIEIGRHTTPVAHVRQHLVPVRDGHKVQLLLHMFGVRREDAADEPASRAILPRGGVLVFCRTRRRVGWVATALERHGVKVGAVHGDRSQAQRENALQGFRDGVLRVLVATDVAARGLHIESVSTVINYDLPVQPEEYVHRIGRAAHGRDHARGEAYTLLDASERFSWRAIVDTTGIEVFAEREVAGWTAPQAARAKAKRREGITATPVPAAKAGKFDPFNRPPRKRGRTHASKPIKKGQKPGGGVKK